MKVKVISNDNFEEITKKGVVLIDFWAEWCGPCQQMLPILDQFAEKMGDKLIVGKVNVDDSPEIAWKFGVMSIPTFILLKDGEMVKDPIVWVKKIEELEEYTKDFIA